MMANRPAAKMSLLTHWKMTYCQYVLGRADTCELGLELTGQIYYYMWVLHWHGNGLSRIPQGSLSGYGGSIGRIQTVPNCWRTLFVSISSGLSLAQLLNFIPSVWALWSWWHLYLLLRLCGLKFGSYTNGRNCLCHRSQVPTIFCQRTLSTNCSQSFVFCFFQRALSTYCSQSIDFKIFNVLLALTVVCRLIYHLQHVIVCYGNCSICAGSTLDPVRLVLQEGRRG